MQFICTINNHLHLRWTIVIDGRYSTNIFFQSNVDEDGTVWSCTWQFIQIRAELMSGNSSFISFKLTIVLSTDFSFTTVHCNSEIIILQLNCKITNYTRKMVPITGRARSFLLVFKNKIERRGRQNKNNRSINLPNVITFSTDFKYTTQS